MERDEISKAASTFINKSCLYILCVEPLIYKFGISTKILDRLGQHKLTLKFKSIVKIFNCIDDETMKKIETKLKSYALIKDELVRKYNQTEIIQTSNIHEYTEFVQNMLKKCDVNRMNKIPDQRVCNTIQIPKNSPNILDQFTCNICMHAFKRKLDLDRHYNRKTLCKKKDVKQLKLSKECPHCKKSFVKKSYITTHIKICKKNIQISNSNTLKELRDKIDKLEQMVQDRMVLTSSDDVLPIIFENNNTSNTTNGFAAQ